MLSAASQGRAGEAGREGECLLMRLTATTAFHRDDFLVISCSQSSPLSLVLPLNFSVLLLAAVVAPAPATFHLGGGLCLALCVCVSVVVCLFIVWWLFFFFFPQTWIHAPAGQVWMMGWTNGAQTSRTATGNIREVSLCQVCTSLPLKGPVTKSISKKKKVSAAPYLPADRTKGVLPVLCCICCLHLLPS